MTLDTDIAAAERTAAARQLIEQAQADVVDLVTVSALELCVLGGPKHPLFEETVTQAWLQLGDRQRKKVIDWVTEGMVERGLLISNSPQPGLRQRDSSYSLKPELGIMLAARCRPWSVVVTEAENEQLRTPRFFALGDQAEPVRGVVVEEPTALPPDVANGFHHIRKLGPLGRFYRYVLISRDKAAEVLAELTIAPPRRSGVVVSPAWEVSAFYPGSANSSGTPVRIQGDGTTARLNRLGLGDGGATAGAACDVAGLRAVMLHLITGAS
jgi:hypothetical protein